MIYRANQVWAADVIFIPMDKGFLYLVAIIDWCSRHVFASEISNSIDARFFVEALETAIERYGTPEYSARIRHASSPARPSGVLKANNIRISMDGKGRWVDNVFVEYLWRSLKYEEVYMKGYDTVLEARKSISEYLHKFNEERRDQSLNSRAPEQMYYESADQLMAA